MELKLYLNRYYEGLDNIQQNTLFSLCMNIKSWLKLVSADLEKGNKLSSSNIVKIYKEHAAKDFRAVNTYLISLGKNPIFERLDDDVEKIDFEYLLVRYDFLMSKVQEEIPICLDLVSVENFDNRRYAILFPVDNDAVEPMVLKVIYTGYGRKFEVEENNAVIINILKKFTTSLNEQYHFND